MVEGGKQILTESESNLELRVTVPMFYCKIIKIIISGNLNRTHVTHTQDSRREMLDSPVHIFGNHTLQKYIHASALVCT